jgi:type VI secretion system protein ImpG
LQRGLLVCGQILELTARQDCFAGRGDLHLFASVLDLFLSVYSSLNNFTQLQLTESISGEKFSWPSRWGERQLI